jgi:hypothetical protein
MVDIPVPRSSRLCAQSGQAIEAGSVFYSVLMAEGELYRRLDYAAAHWKGPPPEAIAWWKTRSAAATGEGTRRQAPNEVLWELFSSLRLSGKRPEMLYVLTLLLLRRRILRAEGDEIDPKHLVVYAPRDDETYTIPAVSLTMEEARQLQEELDRLLFDSPSGDQTGPVEPA